MHLSFQIPSNSVASFIEHWSTKYEYPNEEKYTLHVGKPLTKDSLKALFEWKNGTGSIISTKKMESIRNNYSLEFDGKIKDRYLSHKLSGGAIWNIFFAHCLDPETWPIFDQHTFRAMHYLKTGQIQEIGKTNKQKYEAYTQLYIPFINKLKESFNDSRKIDKALFAFGQFLKIAQRYS